MRRDKLILGKAIVVHAAIAPDYGSVQCGSTRAANRPSSLRLDARSVSAGDQAPGSAFDGGAESPSSFAATSCGTLAAVHAVEIVFAAGWGVFWTYWLVAALSMKRGRIPWSRELRIRALIVVIVVVLVRVGVFRGDGLSTVSWRSALGLGLFALGLAFAIWARVHIGRNWGTPMTEKVEPELVTSGPYHLVRHPIYSGILVAGVGTAVALSWRWLIAVGLVGVYFLYSATVEERFLSEQFPDTYEAYRRATKMLVPFVF